MSKRMLAWFSWVILWGCCGLRAGERDLVVADLRRNPLPAGWRVEGYAFGARKPGRERMEATRPSPNQRQYRTGALLSPPFTLRRRYLAISMDGIFNPGRCFVDVEVGGKVACRLAPAGPMAWRGKPRWFAVDVSAHAGKKANVVFRDDYDYGWIVPERIVQTDEPPAGAVIVKGVPTWRQVTREVKIGGDYLLLAVSDREALMQTVEIEAGSARLAIPVPIAAGEHREWLPVYDLRKLEGEKLRVRYHATRPKEGDPPFRLGPLLPRQASEHQPAFHIHCRFGRLNDPNGLVYHKGVYHLFHQYAYGVRGKMWAHYVSTDLVRWHERPIALFPDELGSMHSGSGAVDVFNTLGLKDAETPAIVLAYTGSRGLGGRDKFQVQCIAYSLDGGLNFTKYPGNPVIGLDHLKTLAGDNSRDPKIFWYSPSRGMDPTARDGHWVMVLFEDGGNSIFTSADLKTWKKESHIGGFHECPELFPLAVDGDPENIRWVMYGGKGDYHIGRFDGKVFTPETERPIPFNHGARHYAAQTFNNTPGNPPRRIQIGWQRDQLTIPLELSLRTTPLGLRLCALPVREIANLCAETRTLDGLELKEGAANPLAGLDHGLYDIELDARLGAVSRLGLTVRGTTIRYDAARRRLTCGRHGVTLPENAGRLALRVVVDNCSIDIFAGRHGLFFMPIYTGPLKDKGLGLRVEGGPVRFERLRVHLLETIWGHKKPSVR